MKDDKLWKVFSEYIRLRDTDENGYGKCITTGKIIHWKDGDAGHFISRRHMATKYNEQNVHLQSRQSNRFNSGDQFAYSRALDLKYGSGTSEKLLVMSRMTSKIGQFEIDELTKYYKAEVKKLISQKII